MRLSMLLKRVSRKEMVEGWQVSKHAWKYLFASNGKCMRCQQHGNNGFGQRMG